MAHGTPDYGVTAGQRTTYQLTDLGELAARLGSIDTHDRRGDVIWMDGFENGIAKWGSSLIGVGASFAASVARARNGSTSGLLKPGNGINDTSQIFHRGPIPVYSRLGFELSVSRPAEEMILSWGIDVYDGTNLMRCQVLWRSDTDVLQYADGALGATNFATGIDLLADASLFHTGKLVVNPTSQRYQRFTLNGTTYDLSTKTPDIVADATLPHLRVAFQEEPLAVNTTGVYVDDVIVTQNEPA